MRITMTREALLKTLNERLAAAKAEDARLTKQHHADEAKALQLFRSRLREALKWDYAKVKTSQFTAGISYHHVPKCPLLAQARIARQIEMVTLDTRKAPFSVSPNTDLYEALTWKPASERQPETACE